MVYIGPSNRIDLGLSGKVEIRVVPGLVNYPPPALIGAADLCSVRNTGDCDQWSVRSVDSARLVLSGAPNRGV